MPIHFIRLFLLASILCLFAVESFAGGPKKTVVCPSTMVPGPTNWWWVTNLAYMNVTGMSLELTFENRDASASSITLPDSTQVWLDGVVQPSPTPFSPPGYVLPVIFQTLPTGIVPYGGTFTYRFTVHSLQLAPASNQLVALRAVPPIGHAVLVNAQISCF